MDNEEEITLTWEPPTATHTPIDPFKGQFIRDTAQVKLTVTLDFTAGVLKHLTEDSFSDYLRGLMTERAHEIYRSARNAML